jgi:hypothetical protein
VLLAWRMSVCQLIFSFDSSHFSPHTCRYACSSLPNCPSNCRSGFSLASPSIFPSTCPSNPSSASPCTYPPKFSHNYLSPYLFFLFVYLSTCSLVPLHIYLIYLSVYLCVYFLVYLSVCPSILFSLSVAVYLSVYLFVCPPDGQPVCQPRCNSILLYLCENLKIYIY